MAPGPIIRLSRGPMVLEVAPEAGGRIAQIRRNGIEQLRGCDDADSAMIGWGCYPMLPWAGRIRRGRFGFGGQTYQLPLNMDAHSIHGVGFAMPWKVESHGPDCVELSLELPRGRHWPFGGTARHRMELGENGLLLRLSVRAGSIAMPATIGWHPWFRKPERMVFSPDAIYPRDGEGIATLPTTAPTPGPWDDCFIANGPVALEHNRQQVSLRSDCVHWVVYDQTPDATCVEPQSGPPDAFNIEPTSLSPGETLARWFQLAWTDR